MTQGPLHWWRDGRLPWKSDIVGRDIITAPVAASWAPNRVDYFAQGMDGQLHHKWWDATPPWKSDTLPLLTSPMLGRYQLGAASWGPDRLDVFGRGDGGEVLHWWWYGIGPWNSDKLPPPPVAVVGSPSAVSWGPNRVDVFAFLIT
jgi:hypothetical protein